MIQSATPSSGAALHQTWDAVIIGGGFAGLSAAIYLGRARRHTLIIDSGQSLGFWEPNVQNYLGFPDGVPGPTLLRLGRIQAQNYGVQVIEDGVKEASRQEDCFHLQGQKGRYQGKRLLLATGLYHIPPDLPGLDECLGKSMFFCKDCDAYRVQGKRIVIIGHNDETVEYALAMLAFSPCVIIATNGHSPGWTSQHEQWIQEYEIPVRREPVSHVDQREGQIRSLGFQHGPQVATDALFTTRGDVYHNALARGLGAETDPEGQIIVNQDFRTNVPGVYAAGCVTPANCQMIIAAGNGATAAQAINRDLFEESLRNHSLRRFRAHQLRTEKTEPEVIT